jgi:hypothetical protein
MRLDGARVLADVDADCCNGFKAIDSAFHLVGLDRNGAIVLRPDPCLRVFAARLVVVRLG